jgi:hypothetical protein
MRLDNPQKGNDYPTEAVVGIGLQLSEMRESPVKVRDTRSFRRALARVLRLAAGKGND